MVTGQFGLESIAFPDAPIDLLADATTAGETVGLYDDPSAIHSAFDPAVAVGYDANARIVSLSIICLNYGPEGSGSADPPVDSCEYSRNQ